jgi:hypothetical protein
MVIGAILELISLVLSGWTVWLVTRVRRRLHSLGASPNSPIHYSLIVRTLIFSSVIFLALAIELFVALADVTVPVPGVSIRVGQSPVGTNWSVDDASGRRLRRIRHIR